MVACGSSASGVESHKEGVGVPQELMPTTFHRDRAIIEYNTIPATSGDHWGIFTQCGFYHNGLPDEIAVHNLEHGNVVVSYNFTNPGDVTELGNIHERLRPSDDWVITRFYDSIGEGEVAVAAWGVLDSFTGIDEGRIREFVRTYRANRLSPETQRLGRGVPCRDAQRVEIEQ